MTAQPKNFPWDEIAAACEQHVRNGHVTLQKWTCGGCGRRMTGNRPNYMAQHCICEDCGFMTDTKQTGCNYTLIARIA